MIFLLLKDNQKYLYLIMIKKIYSCELDSWLYINPENIGKS